MINITMKTKLLFTHIGMQFLRNTSLSNFKCHFSNIPVCHKLFCYRNCYLLDNFMKKSKNYKLSLALF